YNPEIEARRFLDSSIKKNPSLIILLGAGLGYIIKELARKYQSTPILAVHYDKELYCNSIYVNETVQYWYPQSMEKVSRFFLNNINEQTLNNIKIIEWNPSSLIYPEISLFINKELKKIIQQLNGNIKTTAVFGKKWLQNMICNYISIDEYCLLPDENEPIVIASSGSSLRESLSEIKKYRKKFRLWALPSSLKVLNEESVKPDLMICTDPGYYGSYHFQFLQENTPTALPLTASRGIWRKTSPAIILNQNFPFEKDLISLSSIYKTDIPSNGTVSGTALEMATSKSSLIYFAGLDLCYSDIQSHIKPHSFDTLLSLKSTRLSPYQSIMYHRVSNTSTDFTNRIRTSQSMETYRNWFDNRKFSPSISIKRLNPSPIKIKNMKTGYLRELKNFENLGELKTTRVKASNKNVRFEHIRRILEYWENGLKNNERDDLIYYIDTESFSKGEKNHKALHYISRLRRLYG
ncbi:MAG: motility associated factor glycosyltransferase family protein, partial [Deltaproteobacteria bacterium]|nr:motility associated factor glycosyltransferase family protein [Deltaproteobacteria bacterium]